jgi:hypothetical protein
VETCSPRTAYTELSDRLFALTDTLIHRGYGVGITEKHGDTWAWAGELLFGPNGLHYEKAMLYGSAQMWALAVNIAINMGRPEPWHVLAGRSNLFRLLPFHTSMA